jgi:hypothetical protein
MAELDGFGSVVPVLVLLISANPTRFGNCGTVSRSGELLPAASFAVLCTGTVLIVGPDIDAVLSILACDMSLLVLLLPLLPLLLEAKVLLLRWRPLDAPEAALNMALVPPVEA